METRTLTLELFGVHDAARMREARAIRFTVFVDEQQVPPEIELDEHDRDDLEAVHALVRAGGRAVATGRFYADDPVTAHIGRMAVERESRGCGVGAFLLAALVAEARRRGYRRAVLNAQEYAAGFYARAGFVPDGEFNVDAGILHQPMSLRLG